MTDQEFAQCIERITQGDKDGLRQIYEEYIGYIYAVVFDVLKNKENAEDISADFFIKLWSIADTYQSGHGHKGWMIRIARNMSIDFLRKRKREDLSDMMEDTSSDSESESYGKSIYGGNMQSPVEADVVSNQMVLEALKMLNDKEREVIQLKILGDMTFQDIANLLQTPMGTITWRYQNAVKKLRRCGYEAV